LDKCKEQTGQITQFKQQIEEIDQLFTMIPDYLSKIHNIRKNMGTISNRLVELRERSLVLKKQKKNDRS